MPGRLSEMARALYSRVDWHKAGIAASATIILVSGTVLFRRLRDLDWQAVAAAIGDVSAGHLVAAAFIVACGYLTLAFYDWFALRTIGARQVPWRVAAFTGATSYAVGHGVGAMLFASGAIRYRVYARFGLRLIDVAKVCFISGLTFWLGNITALGLGIAYMPGAASAIDQVPAWGNRAIGIAALAALALYLIWVSRKRRVIGYEGSGLALPSGSMTLLQIGIGLADLSCCSLAMYMLMPQAPAIDFISVAVLVVIGTLIGFASHAPGAIGALDVAMLVGLPDFDRAGLVATLLLYRLLYFVAPFAIALAGLAVREAYLYFDR